LCLIALTALIGGVILFKETLGHKTKDGELLVDVLKKKGIVLGIKVDAGTADIPDTDGETYTKGVEDLDKICPEFYKQGCRFAKWRSVLKIGKDLPSKKAIEENAIGLAKYAKICQNHGLVPIVEPEVLVDGTHDIEDCAVKSELVFHHVIRALKDHDVLLEGILLKPNMITPGSESKNKVSNQEMAYQTIRALLRTLPGTVPGVTFLSGGQSEEEATANLNEMNKMTDISKPWKLSFSF
jgi:fructose-bisphosphate aldolase class I